MRASPVSTVLGVHVDALAWRAALESITRWMEERSAGDMPRIAARHVVTLNPEMVMAARVDSSLRAIIQAADLVVPDGAGVVWALRRAGARQVERIPGVDLLVALAERAAGRGWRVFLLGAAPGVAEEVARRLRARFPGLAIAGTYAGEPAITEDAHQAALVRASQAGMLFVAYGTPAQERWIARNRERLGAVVAIGVGGAFDLLAGRVLRAPLWMRRAGMEWAYRLWRQPWRWRRMLALPRFALAVLFTRSPS